MSKIYLPNSTQLDTLNEKVGAIGDTLAGQQLVTKDAVVSALGYEPEKPEGTYELIETITLTEEVATIIRNFEALNAARAYLYFPHSEDQSNCGGLFYFCSDEKPYYLYAYMYNVKNSDEKLSHYLIKAAKVAGNWDVIRIAAENVSPKANGSEARNVQQTVPSIKGSLTEEEFPCITRCAIYAYPDGNTLPLGTVIKIYGIRA